MAAKLARSSYGLSIADCFFSKYNYLINFEYDYLRKIIFKNIKKYHFIITYKEMF